MTGEFGIDQCHFIAVSRIDITELVLICFQWW